MKNPKTYKSVKLADGTWGVKLGRAKGDRVTVVGPRHQDEEAARKAALAYQAVAWIWAAREAIQDLDLEDAKNLAREADEVVDEVVIRLEDEDPDFDPMDPRGFLA